MDVRELRIGSLIHGFASVTPSDKHVHTVDFATIGVVNGDVPMSGQLAFEPIPISEEWLLKLGFKRESVRMLPNKFSYANGGPISFYSSDTAIKVYGIYMYSIKYIHQLQNIHFALTGEELTIK